MVHAISIQLYGHIRLMSSDSNLKTLLSGKMDGRNERGHPHRQWTDDVVEWCGANLQQLSHSGRDWNNWQKTVKQASNVNGHWANDLLWWWWWWVSTRSALNLIRYLNKQINRCISIDKHTDSVHRTSLSASEVSVDLDPSMSFCSSDTRHRVRTPVNQPGDCVKIWHERTSPLASARVRTTAPWLPWPPVLTNHCWYTLHRG